MLEVVVPNVDERHQDGNVAAERGLEEMGIHRVRTGQHFAERFFADGNHQRQADGRPNGITAADPVGHGEDFVGGNAEVLGGGHIGGNGAEVAVDAGIGQTCIAVPSTSGVGIEQGFRCAERFAGNAEYGGFGVEAEKGLGQVGIIGVADKVDADVLPIGLQRLCGHARA